MKIKTNIKFFSFVCVSCLIMINNEAKSQIATYKPLFNKLSKSDDKRKDYSELLNNTIKIESVELVDDPVRNYKTYKVVWKIV